MFGSGLDITILVGMVVIGVVVVAAISYAIRALLAYRRRSAAKKPQGLTPIGSRRIDRMLAKSWSPSCQLHDQLFSLGLPFAVCQHRSFERLLPAREAAEARLRSLQYAALVRRQGAVVSPHDSRRDHHQLVSAQRRVGLYLARIEPQMAVRAEFITTLRGRLDTAAGYMEDETRTDGVSA